MIQQPTTKWPVDVEARSINDALRSLSTPLGYPLQTLPRSGVIAVSREPGPDQWVHTFARGVAGLVSLPGGEAPGFDPGPDGARELIELTYSDGVPGSVVEVHGIRLEVSADAPLLMLADDSTLAPKVAYRPVALAYDPPVDVLNMLRNDVPPDSWTEGGGDTVAPHRVGALAGGVLVALASMAGAVGRLARLQVVVAPSHRRRGLGRFVLHTLAMRVLRQGLLPYGRFAESDMTLLALARSIGFVPFARSLSMRVVTAREGAPAGALG